MGVEAEVRLPSRAPFAEAGVSRKGYILLVMPAAPSHSFPLCDREILFNLGDGLQLSLTPLRTWVTGAHCSLSFIAPRSWVWPTIDRSHRPVASTSWLRLRGSRERIVDDAELHRAEVQAPLAIADLAQPDELGAQTPVSTSGRECRARAGKRSRNESFFR